VTARTKNFLTGQYVTRSVNSCLIPTLSASGWEITTVESLGNSADGYHPIQKRLVGFGGSQCGFCSSGMVMQMYGLTKQGKNFKSEEIEDSFDGNMCRCTGYRPILEAFKSFASDASPDITKKCDDIEDFCKVNAQCAEQCEKKCCLQVSAQQWCTFPTGEIWVKAIDLKGVFDSLKKFQEKKLKYRVVAGNTGTGVFKEEKPSQAYLDVNSVTELLKTEINAKGVTLGAGTNLTDAIEFLKKLENTKGFEYAGGIGKHLKRVANLAVRNVSEN
jgi:xanthine dehydrogenase/oxidase